MHINLRRGLAIFFIGLFFVLLPIILNYSRGYRFDTNKNEMVRTGGISINSNPKNAQVFLNGNHKEPNFFEKALLPFKNVFGIRKMGGTTPAIFQSLLPDEYNIEVTKEGYHLWQKTLDVYAEQVLFAENINLFLQNPEVENIVPANVYVEVFSPDKQNLAYVTKNSDKWELHILDLGTAADSLAYVSSYEIKNISWSQDNSNLFFRTQANEDYIFIDANNPEQITYLKNFSSTETVSSNLEFDNLRWGSASNKLYAQYGHIIYEININTQSIDIFHEFSYQDTESIVDFFVKGGDIWAIQLLSERAELKKFQVQKIAPENNSEISQTVSILPTSIDYEFVHFEKDLVSIKNSQSKNIFIINPSITHLEKSIIAKFFANDIVWDGNQNRILYWDNFEVGIVSLNKENEDLPSHQQIISRYSQQISKAAWSDDENNIILGLENELYAIEVDSRDKRNIHLLAKPDSIKSFVVQDENVIYLVGQINDLAGTYKITVQ